MEGESVENAGKSFSPVLPEHKKREPLFRDSRFIFGGERGSIRYILVAHPFGAAAFAAF